MHGIIFNEIKKFIIINYNIETFNEIKQQAGLQGKFYFTTKSYPDSELDSIVNTTSHILKLERDIILERFGEYIVDPLVKTFEAYIKPEWDCMDLIEETERTMHRAVRITSDVLIPPYLEVERKGINDIEIKYTSERKMGDFGIGIIKGLANLYGENLSIKREPIENGILIKVNRII